MKSHTELRPILVVDDDAKIVQLVTTYLERAGFTVIQATDGRSALASVALEQPALIVLDVMLPEVDGLSVLESVRRTSRTPIIMLSARGAVADRIEGLELGADDYMPKPFSPAELVTRVKRMLERASGGATSATTTLLRHQALAVDRERYEASLDGAPIDLTHAEFRLLSALLVAEGRVLTRDQLIDALRGVDGTVIDRTIDVHIGRLRQKLRDDPAAPRYIATVRGVGYRVPMSGSG